MNPAGGEPWDTGRWGRPAAAALLGAAAYGAAFGLWRSPLQAALSAVKLPAVMAATVLTSAAVCTLLARALGAPLGFRRTLALMASALGGASLLLGALSPVAAFFALQCPAPGAAGDLGAYRGLLVAHTAAVAACGTAGCARLLGRLRREAGGAGIARRVLLAWVLAAGLAGSEWSWVASPFLARPDIPVPLLNPNAFRGNFFEYLWQTAADRLAADGRMR